MTRVGALVCECGVFVKGIQEAAPCADVRLLSCPGLVFPPFSDMYLSLSLSLSLFFSKNVCLHSHIPAPRSRSHGFFLCFVSDASSSGRFSMPAVCVSAKPSSYGARLDKQRCATAPGRCVTVPRTAPLGSIPNALLPAHARRHLIRLSLYREWC